MKRLLGAALGVFTAIGGLDIGDLVTDALIGARFGLSMVWVTVVAVIGIIVYSEMAGRVATITHRLYGLTGLLLFVFVLAVWQLNPDWGSMWHEATHPSVPRGEGLSTYFFYAIVMLGAQMTPYEVFFFSSAAVEHKWDKRDLADARLNVLIGYPVGGLLAIGIQATAALALRPAGIQVEHLSQTALPVVVAFGKVGLACAALGIVAATFGSVLETLLSSGYTVAQNFGWRWGKSVAPVDANRFSALVVATLIAATAFALTTINPITVTIYSVYLGAATLPFTYVPILIVANDRRYLGDQVNGRMANGLGVVYLVIVSAAALAALPLLIATKAGL